MDGQVILDISTLLEPVPGDAPTGIDLRSDASPQSIYLRLKDARAAARAAERRGDADGQTIGVVPEWKVISTLAQEALRERTKDLEIAAWLIEALVRLHGFAGLHAGLTLTRSMAETFWDGLHSLKDEDGMATFVAPLSGLNGVDGEGTLIQPLRKIPITTGAEDALAAYHFDQAAALSQISDEAARAARISAGAVPIEGCVARLRKSPQEFLTALMRDIEGSIAELDGLAAILEEKCGNDAPPTSTIKNIANQVLEILREHAGDLIIPAEEESAPESEGDEAAGGEGGARVKDGAMNREEALRQIIRIAEYFRRAEPQSPLSYTLNEAVRRARLSLPELLAELLSDSADAQKMFLITAGIKPIDDTSG